MRIDRVVDFDYGSVNYMDTHYFLDFSAKVNFVVSVHCNYKGKLEDWEELENPDLNKLIPEPVQKIRLNSLSRKDFEEDRENWLEEPENAMQFENIKPDKIFWFGVNKVSKKIIKDTFGI